MNTPTILVAGSVIRNGRAFLIAPMPAFYRRGGAKPDGGVGPGETISELRFPTRITICFEQINTRPERVRWELDSKGPTIFVDGKEETSGEIDIEPSGRASLVLEPRYASCQADDVILSFRNQSTGGLETSVSFTVFSDLRMWFGGRFEARLATDNDNYYDPTGDPESDDRSRGGWTWTLPGEPEFCSSDIAKSGAVEQNVTSNDVETRRGLGRLIRFNNPQFLRPHVEDIGVRVVAIEGRVGRQSMRFEWGDEILGAFVDLGPHSYFAANREYKRTVAGTIPLERHDPGRQPIGRFEFNVQLPGHSIPSIKGSSFTKGVNHMLETSVPHPYVDDRPRPRGRGFGYRSDHNQLDQQLRSAFGIKSLHDFATDRAGKIAQDLGERIKKGEASGNEFKGLLTRLSLLFANLSDADVRNYRDLFDPYFLEQGISAGKGAPSNPSAWGANIEFVGVVSSQTDEVWRREEDIGNPPIVNLPNGVHDVDASPVLRYLKPYTILCNERANKFGFNFRANFFNFHSDELCGQVVGCIYPKDEPQLADHITGLV